MITRYKVWCIKKRETENIFRKVSHIGGLTKDYYRWNISMEEAISGIEIGRWNFYIQKNGSPVDLVVAESPDGIKYLKTEVENTLPETLLSMPFYP